MRILFLNQYFPPDPAPTGLLLAEVADLLETHGHTVDLVAARQDYRAGQRKRGRAIREILALAAMLSDGLRRPRADIVVSASSPPCVLVVATMIAARHRSKSLHWAMDLYPELAVALEEIRQPLVTNTLSRLMSACYRRTDQVVALDGDMAERLGKHRIKTEIIRPWVLQRTLDQRSTTAQSQQPWTWIYSGNLGRAHEWETLLQTQAILEAQGADIRLLFQGGGPAWPSAQTRANELALRRCEWRPYVADNELVASLLRCNCCVVTQRPETQGLLWPSKLGLVLTLPRPILWIGPQNGAIGQELRKSPHAGIFSPGHPEEVAEWLLACRRSDPAAVGMLDAEAERLRGLTRWKQLIDAIANSA